jgi:uncharacterized membrane protein
MKDCFKNSFKIKVIGINVIFEINNFKRSFSYKEFSNYSKLLSEFLRREVTIFEINEKMRVKTLTYVASRVTKHSERNKHKL